MSRTGMQAEEPCALLLRDAGLRILARNWRCRHGEIDRIVEQDGALVFGEGRPRRDAPFGGAAERVTAAKRAAARPQAPCRFHILVLDALKARRVQCIRDAFGE